MLSDKQKRARYDQFGHAGVGGAAGGNPFGGGGNPFQNGNFNFNGQSFNFDFGGGGGFDDILGSIFGFGNTRRPRRGADYQTSLNVLEPLMNIFEWENLLPVKKEQENL